MPKWGTIAVDSVGEMARMTFSWDMKKKAGDFESIRQVNNYPGTTERLNMFARQCKTFRDRGVNIVFTAHEDIQTIYAKGGAITPKGQTPQEPIGVKGWPDLPGKRAPDEFCRAVDNVIRVRFLNGQPTWILIRESLGGGGEFWDVKTRFDPNINGGRIACNYRELEAEAKKLMATGKDVNWNPPYIWMLYGAFGIQKTRSLRFFPQPILIYDLDRGTKSLTAKEIEENHISIRSYDVEDKDSWQKFVVDFSAEASQ